MNKKELTELLKDRKVVQTLNSLEVKLQLLPGDGKYIHRLKNTIASTRLGIGFAKEKYGEISFEELEKKIENGMIFFLNIF